MYRRKISSSGFTMIELILAMAFISALLLSIVLLSIYLGNLYNRGSTMKDINQSAAELSSDIKRTIASSKPGEILYKRVDAASPYATPSPNDDVKLFCAGAVSYVVNPARNLSNRFNNGPNAANDAHLVTFSAGVFIHLARVNGINLCGSGLAAPCAATINNVTQLQTALNTSCSIPSTQKRELLAQESSHSLSVWEFTPRGYPANPVAVSSNVGIVDIFLTMGTGDSSDIDFPTSIDFPGDVDSPGDYLTCRDSDKSEWCGINTFEIVARTSNLAD